MTNDRSAHLNAVLQYYERADAGRADTSELFTHDAEVYFPKFGIATGRRALGELGIGLGRAVASIAHDPTRFRIVEAGDTVVVEGFTHGTDRAGREWDGGRTPGGRFCSVFEFDGELISRMHIYLDPDYTAQDTDRFLWGLDRTW
jgi:hypothetical protein